MSASTPSARSFALLLTGALFLTACSPTIKVSTPEAVKLDVKMTVDVYSKSDPRARKDEDEQMQAAITRRNQQSEIQTLKNDRVAGENREGYLALHQPPADPKYLEYARKLISSENNSRAVIYLAAAQREGKPMEMLQHDYAQLWRDRSFPGEWIQKDDGTWVQK
jgi:uncharacterized protein